MGMVPAPCLGWGGGSCCCWKMPICQNGNVWQQYIRTDKLLSAHSQGGSGKAARRVHHPHSSSSHQEDPVGLGLLCGAATGAVFWGCILGLPLGAAAKLCPISRCSTGQDAKSGAFAFLALQTEGKMGLKRDLEVRCWGSPLN